jgi:hypothetical protein
MKLCLLNVGDDGTQWIQGTFFLDHKSFPAIYCLQKIFKKSSFKKTILPQRFFSIQPLPIDVGNDMGTPFSPYWRVYRIQRTNTFNNQDNISLHRRAPSALSLHTLSGFVWTTHFGDSRFRSRLIISPKHIDSVSINYPKFSSSHKVEAKEDI